MQSFHRCAHERLIPFGHEKTKRLGLPYGKYEYLGLLDLPYGRYEKTSGLLDLPSVRVKSSLGRRAFDVQKFAVSKRGA